MNVVMPQDIPEQLLRHVPDLKATNPDRVRIEPELLAQLVETAFFASIATDEGRIAPLRLVYSEREDARRPQPQQIAACSGQRGESIQDC